MNGILNLAFPTLDAIDAGLALLMPPWARLAVYGAASGAVAMLLYRLLSRQEAIRTAQARGKQIRLDLGRSDEPSEALRLALGNLVVAFSVLRLVTLPALLSAVPAIVVIAWVAMRFMFAAPLPGTEVGVIVEPAGVVLYSAGDGIPKPVQDRITWPARGNTGILIDENGMELGRVPPSLISGVLHQKRWWNILLGNESGYLPEQSRVDVVSLVLPRREVLPYGPSWLCGWEFVFFTAMIVVSLYLKVRLRIA